MMVPETYEWDPRKAQSNFRKHGVHCADAVAVLEDELAVTIRDPRMAQEERWITIGMDALGRLIVVVWTWRRNRIRVISARGATAAERTNYEESHEM
jgi:uncharacterized protein